MPITFACECGKQLKTGDENAGKRVKCPACGEGVLVPSGKPATAPVKAPAGGMTQFNCECGKQLQAKAELVGKKVKCPGCGETLMVPGGENGVSSSQPAAKKPDLAAATTKAPKPKAPPPELEIEDDPPPRGRSRQEEEDEDRPRKARRRVEEDDLDIEDDRPAKKRKAAKGSSAPLLIGIGAFVLLLLAGGGFAGYWFFIRDNTSRPIVNNTNNPDNQQKKPEPIPDFDAAGNLKQLAMSMQEYNTAKQHLPVGIRDPKTGAPLLSWRVELLPYLGPEGKQLYEEFKLDEPWDSPHNKALLTKMPRRFQHPDRPASGAGMTYFQVFAAAPRVPYPSGISPPFPDPLMIVPPGQPVPAPKLPDSFKDGPSDTILIVEAATAVPWTKPEDISYYPVTLQLPRPGDPTKPTFLAAMADGSVRVVPRTIKDKTLRSAINLGDGQPLDPEFPSK